MSYCHQVTTSVNTYFSCRVPTLIAQRLPQLIMDSLHWIIGTSHLVIGTECDPHSPQSNAINLESIQAKTENVIKSLSMYRL